MKTVRRSLQLVVVCSVLLAPGLAGSAENLPPDQKTMAMPTPDGITNAEKNKARAIFAAQCSWCHGNYGLTADKGPRLAGTQMTEQEVEERIRDGKAGYMPSFRKFLNDEQIALMAKVHQVPQALGLRVMQEGS